MYTSFSCGLAGHNCPELILFEFELSLGRSLSMWTRISWTPDGSYKMQSTEMRNVLIKEKSQKLSFKKMVL
jgi:hypothetical protein